MDLLVYFLTLVFLFKYSLTLFIPTSIFPVSHLKTSTNFLLLLTTPTQNLRRSLWPSHYKTISCVHLSNPIILNLQYLLLGFLRNMPLKIESSIHSIPLSSNLPLMRLALKLTKPFHIYPTLLFLLNLKLPHLIHPAHL